MAVVKMINEGYHQKSDFINLIYYVCRKAEDIGGYGITLTDIPEICLQFEYVKAFWGKAEEGRRQARHFIVSFSNKELCTQELMTLGWQIAAYYGYEFQVLWGVHADSANLHIHFVVNTVNYRNGKMLSEGYEDLKQLKLFVANIENSFFRGKRKIISDMIR